MRLREAFRNSRAIPFPRSASIIRRCFVGGSSILVWDYGYIANPIDGSGGLWTLRKQKTVQPIQKTPAGDHQKEHVHHGHQRRRDTDAGEKPAHLSHLRCKLVITELMLANAYNLSKCGVFPHAYTYV